MSKQVEDQYAPDNPAGYPAVLGKLDAAERVRLGEAYLESVRVHRKLGRPRFTDKMGPNYVYIGLLQLILPKAKIVDVRRHPLACGWSNFSQHYAKGQNFSYRLADIGRLSRDYVELMAHFDRVLPGKVHRVFYEQLVSDPEAEVRCLLDNLELPFENACLEFHKTDRAVMECAYDGRIRAVVEHRHTVVSGLCADAQRPLPPRHQRHERVRRPDRQAVADPEHQ